MIPVSKKKHKEIKKKLELNEKCEQNRGIRGYKLPIIKQISHGDVTYSLENIVNNIVLILCGGRYN